MDVSKEKHNQEMIKRGSNLRYNETSYEKHYMRTRGNKSHDQAIKKEKPFVSSPQLPDINDAFDGEEVQPQPTPGD